MKHSLSQSRFLDKHPAAGPEPKCLAWQRYYSYDGSPPVLLLILYKACYLHRYLHNLHLTLTWKKAIINITSITRGKTSVTLGAWALGQQLKSICDTSVTTGSCNWYMFEKPSGSFSLSPHVALWRPRSHGIRAVRWSPIPMALSAMQFKDIL